MSDVYRNAFPAEVWTGSGNVGRAGFLPETAVLEPSALIDLSPEEKRARYRAILERGIHGISYSPYMDGQEPGMDIGADQIRQRMEIVRPTTRWIRSFSCCEGHEATPRIAHELGLKTMVGLSIGSDREKNEEELAAGIEIAKAGHADIMAVGNEILLRGDLNANEIIEYMDRLREAAPDQCVAYVDAYFLYENHPQMAEACDVVLINCYPFWERCPLEYSLPYMQEMVRRARAVAGDKKVVISETGWPTSGSPYGGAIPGDDNALVYFIQTYEWAEQEGLEVFWFSSFDENWKTGDEGDVGSTWGLWHSDGSPKF